ncbi:MAG: aspartate aminotransferase family protein [Spirochaetia bacterium]|jgi:4-aminobutyrate aminotransferase|nr:aspartate aminotransferase family protein [Spirochaetia bacterium]
MSEKMSSQLKLEGDINISEKRKKWQDENIGKETAEILEEDSRYFLKQSLSSPCLNVLKSAKGAWIEDYEGRKYLDFHGNNVHQAGFGNKDVVDAVKKQLDELSFCTRRYTNKIVIEFAKKIASLTPGNLNKMLFAPGGAEAISIAIKLARIATGRYKTISMWDSFHGATLDAISIGGEAVFRKGIGPLLSGTEHVPPPDIHRRFMDIGKPEEWEILWAKYIEYILEKEGDIAAVISEPMRSTPYVPSKEYWQIVRKACDKYGALLIFDEIPHALGRTGKWFTCQNFDVTPDILVIGKGLGGGVFPIAATIADEKLDVAGHIALGHFTHEKSTLGAAAGLAAINYIEKNNLVEHSRTLGKYSLKKANEMMERHPLIGAVRGIGLFIGIELVKNRETREIAAEEAEEVMYRALSKGVSFKLTMGNILTLTPSLVITKEEMDFALNAIEEAISEVENK